jgi:hypothetical protein
LVHGQQEPEQPFGPVLHVGELLVCERRIDAVRTLLERVDEAEHRFDVRVQEPAEHRPEVTGDEEKAGFPGRSSIVEVARFLRPFRNFLIRREGMKDVREQFAVRRDEVANVVGVPRSISLPCPV